MPDSPRLFPTTSRTLVEGLHSSEQKVREMSLARFCTLYYPAIYGYARTLGLAEADAKDRVQDFFVEVTRDDLLTKFDRSQGSRLSSWLMKCFKNQIISYQARSNAQKRGGGLPLVPLDDSHAEHSYRAAHLAHLEPAPTFDLMLAREIWLAARQQILHRHRQKGHAALVEDLLPFTLMDRWPPRPMPSQEEIAVRHDTTLVRLKAFFNRTLRVQSRRFFELEAQRAAPGIDEAELEHLWHLLCHYGEM